MAQREFVSPRLEPVLVADHPQDGYGIKDVDVNGDGDGRLGVATMGYYTPGYFLADNPQVLVFLNRSGAPASATERRPAC